MLCMDKTAVGRLKTTSVFPLYMALMNQKADDRYDPSSIILAGYLPHFRKRMVAGVKSKQWSHLRTTHHCLAIFLAALNLVQEKGIYLKDRNGGLHWVKPFIGYVNSDNEEQNDQCLVMRGGDTFFPSRQTLMSRDLIGTVVPRREQRGSRRDEFRPRTDASHKALVFKAWKMTAERKKKYRGDTKDLLATMSLHPIVNAYWSVPMGPGGIYKSTWAEVLHLGPQGFMKKIRDNIYDILKVCWHNYKNSNETDDVGGLGWAVALIEERMRALPIFTDGITRISHFANGCWGLKWVSAEDHISMFQQLVCLTLLGLMGSPWACAHALHKHSPWAFVLFII
jgi:hypothetical protein